MEFNKNNIPLHTDNKKEHNNVSFERNKKDKEQEKLKEERIRYEKERLKLEKMISRRIEKADKKEKRENKSINARLNNKIYEDEYTHMFISKINWDEDSSYYAKIWGNERDEVISYFKEMDFDRGLIPKER